jgi:hypothetical protein
MRKALIAGIALLSMVTVVEAQQHRHYQNQHQHRGGGGGGWVAPLVGGLVLGGVLYGLSQTPSYAAPHPYYQQPVSCWEEFVGYNRWGNPVYRRVCQ